MRHEKNAFSLPIKTQHIAIDAIQFISMLRDRLFILFSVIIL